MTQLSSAKPPEMARVDALSAIQPSQFELWKYYEDRADKIGGELWSVGAWLMTIMAATLSLPFVAGFIKASTRLYPPEIPGRLPAALIATFGILMCIYSYFALRDMREHIENNWRKAGYVLSGTWQSEWTGRKGHGWKVLLLVGSLALLAFAGMLVAAVAA